MVGLNRLLILAAMLSSENGATIHELLNDSSLEYSSRSSIYSDIESLTKRFGIYVERTDEKRGRSGKEVVYRIDHNEWLAFRTGFISRSFDDRDRRLLSFMIESVGSMTPLVDAAGDGFLPKLVSILGGMTISSAGCGGYFGLKETKNLDILLEAQQKESLLYITYNGDRRELYPLKCFVFSGGVYCYVMKTDGFVYSLSVPRIEKIERPLIMAKMQRPKPSVDIDWILSDPFGIVRGKKEFDAVVRLDYWQGLYEKEKSWPDRVSLEDKGDHWLFKVRTSGDYWLKRWVLSLGETAELLEPTWLREEIKDETKRMLEVYK